MIKSVFWKKKKFSKHNLNDDDSIAIFPLFFICAHSLLHCMKNFLSIWLEINLLFFKGKKIYQENSMDEYAFIIYMKREHDETSVSHNLK